MNFFKNRTLSLKSIAFSFLLCAALFFNLHCPITEWIKDAKQNVSFAIYTAPEKENRFTPNEKLNYAFILKKITAPKTRPADNQPDEIKIVDFTDPDLTSATNFLKSKIDNILNFISLIPDGLNDGLNDGDIEASLEKKLLKLTKNIETSVTKNSILGTITPKPEYVSFITKKTISNEIEKQKKSYSNLIKNKDFCNLDNTIKNPILNLCGKIETKSNIVDGQKTETHSISEIKNSDTSTAENPVETEKNKEEPQDPVVEPELNKDENADESDSDSEIETSVEPEQQETNTFKRSVQSEPSQARLPSFTYTFSGIGKPKSTKQSCHDKARTTSISSQPYSGPYTNSPSSKDDESPKKVTKSLTDKQSSTVISQKYSGPGSKTTPEEPAHESRMAKVKRIIKENRVKAGLTTALIIAIPLGLSLRKYMKNKYSKIVEKNDSTKIISPKTSAKKMQRRKSWLKL